MARLIGLNGRFELISVEIDAETAKTHRCDRISAAGGISPD
jgi:hypothetical protein